CSGAFYTASPATSSLHLLIPCLRSPPRLPYPTRFRSGTVAAAPAAASGAGAAARIAAAGPRGVAVDIGSTGAGSVDGVGDILTGDRKSTRLNSSHGSISYVVFCLKKKNKPPKSRATTP